MTSNELKQIRTKSKLTQSEFAQAIGVSGRTVEAWEQGRRNITELAKREIYRQFKEAIWDKEGEEDV